MKSRVYWLVGFVSLLLLSLFLVLSIQIYLILHKKLQLDPKHPKAVFVVKKNTSTLEFIHQLQSYVNFKYPSLLYFWLRMTGDSHRLQAGIYSIDSDMRLFELIKKISDGKVLVNIFPIIAGQNVTQITEVLKKAPFLDYVANDWDIIRGQYITADGLLLADSYAYQAGSSSLVILKAANKNLWTYLDKAWRSRSQNLPYESAYELLIAASIIEKETGVEAERPVISSVIVNRLLKNMRLQMDPTVIYACGSEYDGHLNKRDLQIDSPYNTYKVKGLPPTPIAMVGKSSIDAAANPARTDFLYFVAKGDGTHQFSNTYDEQKSAIRRYIYQEREG